MFKSETAKMFKRRVGVLTNAVYNIYEISAEIVKEHGTLVNE